MPKAQQTLNETPPVAPPEPVDLYNTYAGLIQEAFLGRRKRLPNENPHRSLQVAIDSIRGTILAAGGGGDE